MKKLGFGMMRLPLPDPDNRGQVDVDQVCAMVDTFLERGFTYFDTAYMYHDYNSERVVRKTLVERHPRESFTLATKLPLSLMKDSTPADQERIFNEQLEKCGVTYFDYYLLHNLNKETYACARRLDSFAFIQEKKAAGLIKKIGFSFHDTAALLDEILTAHPEVDFIQLQLNYLDWDSPSIQSRLCYETAVRHGKQVVVMEPVKGGILAHVPASAADLFRNAHPDWSIPSWGIRYAASLPNVMVVLSGMSDLTQLQDNTGYMADFQPLTQTDLAVVSQAVEIIHSAWAIPCTSCRYCVEGCPQHIAIPDYFALYNSDRQMEGKGLGTLRNQYEMIAKNHGRASDCIACGQCESACPQHIEIISWLEKVAATFEQK